MCRNVCSVIVYVSACVSAYLCVCLYVGCSYCIVPCIYSLTIHKEIEVSSFTIHEQML